MNMSETFSKIDSPQHLEISRQTYPTNRSKIRATTLRTIHTSMTGTFQCEYCQSFTFRRCDKYKLKCTSHGGMYSAHYFGKISIT